MYLTDSCHLVSNLTLSAWGEHNRQVDNNDGSASYIITYGVLVLAASILSGAASIFLWVYCAVRSGRALHDAVGTARMWLCVGGVDVFFGRCSLLC